MKTQASPYPQPQTDRDNEEFLAAWREGRLLLQFCEGCGRSFFYPRPLCPYCWSKALRWEPASSSGEVVSFSLIYRPNHPSFFDETPIVLGEIRVAEGVTLLARIVGADATRVRTGMAVSLVPVAQSHRYPLPTFQPLGS